MTQKLSRTAKAHRQFVRHMAYEYGKQQAPRPSMSEVLNDLRYHMCGEDEVAAARRWYKKGIAVRQGRTLKQ